MGRMLSACAPEAAADIVVDGGVPGGAARYGTSCAQLAERCDRLVAVMVTDFGATFPIRIHAFLEDLTNGVSPEHLRSSGRDALATMEYIFAAIDSYESGGEIVRPHALPPIHGALGRV